MAQDIWLFNSTSEGELPLKWDGTPKAVSGVELLVNIFTLVFLTEIDSDLARPEAGTELATSIDGNIIARGEALRGTIILAMRQAVAIIKADQNTSTPLDEFLVAATLLDLFAGADSISVRIALETSAGITRIIKIPTSVVI